jgi:nucleotide-binding universal stress UspA family protein
VVQAWSVYAEGYMSVRGGISDDAINEMRRFARRQYSSQVDNLLADAKLGSITVYKHLPRSEDVSNAIVSLAKSKKVDLLVMGTVCRTGVAGLIIGNTAEKVLNRVDCSVLTVKPEGFVTPVTLEDR